MKDFSLFEAVRELEFLNYVAYSASHAIRDEAFEAEKLAMMIFMLSDKIDKLREQLETYRRAEYRGQK